MCLIIEMECSLLVADLSLSSCLAASTQDVTGWRTVLAHVLAHHVWSPLYCRRRDKLLLFTALHKHDVAFLISVRPPYAIGTVYTHQQPFVPQVGLVYVRGCEIEGMLDENGRVIEEGQTYNAATITFSPSLHLFL